MSETKYNTGKRKYYDFSGWRWYTSLDDIYSYCSNKKTYIYGAGEYGHFLQEQLKDNNIDVVGYLVSNGHPKTGGSEYCKVYNLNEVDLLDDDIAIVIASNEQYCHVMSKNLKELGVDNYRVLDVIFRRPLVDTNKYPVRKNCLSQFEDGIIRIRITNRCPGKCDFCGLKAWPDVERQREMPPEWYFDYLRPLYPKTKIVLITGGDAFYSKYSYEYIEFLSNEYPHITLCTETNGLTFDEKIQTLSAKNLCITHVSVNASNPVHFKKGCWSSPGSEVAYRRIINNLTSYINKLKKEDKLCFAPNISMVINQYTADDILDFIRMALKMQVSYVTFFFDYRENAMSSDYFSHPEIARKALRTLLEVERVLMGKFHIEFRLWIPLKELAIAESEIDECDLESKYLDLLDLAKDRSVVEECKKRNFYREIWGKKQFKLEEDFEFTLRTTEIGGKKVCNSAWKLLDIYPNGRLDFCSWHVPTLYLPEYINNGKCDWESIINSHEFSVYRSNMLHDDYTGCMACCPVIKAVKR